MTRCRTVFQLSVLASSSTAAAVLLAGQSRVPSRPWGYGHFPPDENPQFFPTPIVRGNSEFDEGAFPGTCAQWPNSRWLDR